MYNRQRAFTLIELSIVLVIIGLIVGGVLVGRDLIGTATVRAQITQIDKYQTAVNTLKVNITTTFRAIFRNLMHPSLV